MNDKNEFYNLLKTDRDRTLALLFLNNLYENLYKTDTSFSNFLSKNQDEHFAKIILGQFPSDWLAASDKERIEKKINELKKEIQILPTISLTIAIHPNEELLKALEHWAEVNFKTKMIFDIRVNPEIIGGAIVIRNGSYKDFSLSKKIDEIFAARHEDIVSAISGSNSHQPVIQHSQVGA
jgi:hypothetical protein